MKIKKGDQVVVVIGKDKGSKGKVEKVFPVDNQVLVMGVNIYKKHTKPAGEGKPGGIVDLVKPLNVAKVALICPKCGQKTRVGYQIMKEGKERICRKCKAII